MPEENPQLTHISDQIDIIIGLLKEKAESTGPIPNLRDILPPDSRLLQSTPGRTEDHQASNKAEEVRQVVQQAEPVRITDIAPKTLGALGEKVTSAERSVFPGQKRDGPGTFASNLA